MEKREQGVAETERELEEAKRTLALAEEMREAAMESFTAAKVASETRAPRFAIRGSG